MSELNPRQREFVRLVAGGMTPTGAYRAVYAAEGHAAESSSSRLMRHPAVVEALTRARGQTAGVEPAAPNQIDPIVEESEMTTATLEMAETIEPTAPAEPGPADAVAVNAREALAAAVRLFDYMLGETLRTRPDGTGESGLPELCLPHFAEWLVPAVNPHRRGLLKVVELAREAREKAKAALAQLLNRRLSGLSTRAESS
jgi:hypothetical protein